MTEQLANVYQEKNYKRKIQFFGIGCIYKIYVTDMRHLKKIITDIQEWKWTQIKKWYNAHLQIFAKLNHSTSDKSNNWAWAGQNQQKWPVHPGKTQMSLGIRPVWSESSLYAWWKLRSLATYWVHSKDSDHTGWMSRLIWVFAGHTCHFVCFVMLRVI